MILAEELVALVQLEPRLAPVLAELPPIAQRSRPAGFPGLVWTVCGQQLSTHAAAAIYARVEALGAVTPEALATRDDAVLRGCGLSGAKVRTLRDVAAAGLDYDALGTAEAESAIETLCLIKGIGRWTAEVYLMFAAGHPDIFPAGDLALREGARGAMNLPARPTELELRAVADGWRPHRSAAAHLLWAHYGAMKRAGRAAA